jgi:hypothetical protein
MTTLTASLFLALLLPGSPAEKNAATTPSLAVSTAVSVDQTQQVLADLTQFSGSMPILAAPDAAVIKPIRPIKPVKRETSPFVTRNWLVMTAIQHSTATFDAWSTRYSISSGRGHELNPLMKPFAGSGAIYGVIQLAPMATDYLGKRLMRSNHPTLRKLWWLPQAAGSAGFMLSGINNLRVASH